MGWTLEKGCFQGCAPISWGWPIVFSDVGSDDLKPLKDVVVEADATQAHTLLVWRVVLNSIDGMIFIPPAHRENLNWSWL